MQNRESEYPEWLIRLDEDWEEEADRVNALTFARNHEKSWAEVHQNWKQGFPRFLESGSKITERDLLNGDRYPWLNGISLAFILIASYDHHQEDLDKLLAWLRQETSGPAPSSQ